jgi:acyl-CoA dehydrogenase
MKDARSVEDDFLGRAEALTDLAPARRQPGDEKVFADLLLARMRAAGLLSVAVPPEFGGPGLGLAATARITERIARHSGSAGLIYAMHMSQAFSVVRHGRGAFFEALQDRMVREQILIASGTSEKGPGGDIFTSLARVAPGADGRIAGAKESPNISYLDQAGLILLTANMAAEKGPDRQVLIALDMADVQLEAPHRAGFLGMRGILNQPARLIFTAPREAVFSTPFAPIARRTMTPCIHVLWAAMWSGIAWGAIEKARVFLRQEVGEGSDAAVLARHALSRIVNRHATLNALVRAAIQACETDMGQGDIGQGDIGLGAAARINRLKITGSELLVGICLEALQLIGLRAYAAAGPYSLAEAMADALSAPVMVSNTRLQMNTAAVEGFAEEAL